MKTELQIISFDKSKGKVPDLDAAIRRLCWCGEYRVKDLALALESPEEIHRRLAGSALYIMTDSWDWKEAYDFIQDRLRSRPPSKEAGRLLLAVAHSGAKDYPQLVSLAQYYLNDVTLINTMVINNPNNRIEMRVCDYAALVIKYAAIARAPDRVEWGLDRTRLMTRATLDEELPLIKKWVEAHPNWVKERQRELRKQRMAEEKDSKRKLKPGPEPEDAP